METATSTPWHQSMKLLLIVTILLPPVGLVMLWMRKDTPVGQKIFASFAILAMSASYLYFAYSSGFFARRENLEAHYAELERQRAEQRDEARRVDVQRRGRAIGEDVVGERRERPDARAAADDHEPPAGGEPAAQRIELPG